MLAVTATSSAVTVVAASAFAGPADVYAVPSVENVNVPAVDAVPATVHEAESAPLNGAYV